VGYSANIEASTGRYFLWEHGTMRELVARPGEPIFRVSDINLFGVIAATVGAGPRQAALLSRGQVMKLPLPAGQTDSAVNAINNRGDAVGTQGTTAGVPPVVWLRR
jgi:hypothetical protein